MGRRRRASFPVSTQVKSYPATSPASSRMVVPDPTQFTTSSGSRSPSNPRPRTRRVSGPSSSTPAPSACTAWTEARQSPLSK